MTAPRIARSWSFRLCSIAIQGLSGLHQRQAPSAQRRAPNAQRPAPNAQRQAPSAKRQTPNAKTPSDPTLRPPMFPVPRDA
jgi:hypothetical protein